MIRKVTRVLGGYGQSGRMLRSTIPTKIARLLEIRRGDRIKWEMGPGNSVILTLEGHGVPRKYVSGPVTRQVRRKTDVDFLIEGLAETAGEIL